MALSYLVDDPGVSTVAIDGVEPTLENTYSGKYPVWTYEHMYTKGEPNDVVAAFPSISSPTITSLRWRSWDTAFPLR